MILADKIVDLRKKHGWSQEELAERLNVTRQAVSKWEGAQSVPDLDKILQMSRLFGVSTDYLLKDELEAPDIREQSAIQEEGAPRRVSLAEASEFLEAKRATTGWIALATFLCILSPVPLMLLAALSEYGKTSLSENAAGGLGVMALLLVVSAAVAIFILCGSRTGRFEYLDRELIDTEYGVSGLAREWQRRLQPRRTVFNILGACLCILSVLPLFAALCVTEDGIVMIGAVCVLLLLAGIGVVLFILVGIPWESTQKLLQEGDYTRKSKLRPSLKGAVSTVYWLLAVALFLLLGFRGNGKGDWDYAARIVFPIAGVLFAAIRVLWSALERRTKE